MPVGWPTRDGHHVLGERVMTGVPPNKRNAGMVFQSYALWPHMTVRENVRFGLAVRRVPREEQARRVDEVLRLVQLERYADRNEWDMVAIVHGLDEWKKNDPGKSSKPIPFEDILEAIGRHADKEAILQDAKDQAAFDRLFAEEAR